MNDLQRRLVTILRNLPSPMTAKEIRHRCQLPQTVESIEADLRGLAREGKALRLRGDEWAAANAAKTVATPKKEPEKPTRKQRMKSTKQAVPKAEQGEAPVSAPATALDDELALMAGLRLMEESISGHVVADADAKIMVLQRISDMSPPRVAAMLGRVIDEDLEPFREGRGLRTVVSASDAA